MKTRPLILVLLLTAALAPAPAKSGGRFVDPDGRFTLVYPARWRQRDVSDRAVTAFVAPLEYRRDVFQETASVRVQTYPDGQAPTLAEARAALRREMEARNATLCDSDGRSKLSGRPAHRYTWAIDAGGLRLTFVQLLAIDRGRLFVVTFTTQSGHEHIYRRDAEAMLASFEINPAPPATRPAAG